MSEIQPNTDYTFTSLSDGKCWTVEGANATEGTLIVQNVFSTNPSQTNQRFQLVDAGEGLYYIMTTPAFGSFYITICQGDSPQNPDGVSVLMITQNKDNYSTFKVISSSISGPAPILNVGSSMYVYVRPKNANNITYVAVYFRNDQQENQLWTINLPE